jgi:hypothetical protein
MKKTLLFTVFVIVSLASCKKSSSVAPANTLSASFNGTPESFNTNLFGQNGSGVTLNSSLSILGTNGSASGADLLTITLTTNNTITTGTYTNAPNSNDGFVSILYQVGPLNLLNPDQYTSDVNGNYLTTVKITSISSTNIQGTFNAQLVYSDGKTIKTVTNGVFNVHLN